MNGQGTEFSPLVDITDREFEDLSSMVYTQFGINLTDKKKTLVRGRLHKVLQARNLGSFSQYLDVVRRDATGMVLVELIDRISTNHTFFFREADHFSFLHGDVFQHIAASGASEIRLWCAGCATGEEAYTLAMLGQTWAEAAGFRGRIRVLATDISLTALEHAVKGEYADERVRLVPQALRQRFFRPTGTQRWQVDSGLRDSVLFKRLNFMDASFPFQNQFHVIFCRNVMIYFDRDTKNSLVQKLTGSLLPGHWLFIGHSETLGRDLFDLEYVRPSVYRRRQS